MLFRSLIEPIWTRKYLDYLLRNQLPEDPSEARQIERRSRSFTVINGELYKRSVSRFFQRCIAPEDGREILRDIHQGDCEHHASSRAIVGKAYRAGFYWLTAAADAKEFVKRCDGCQRFANKPHMPATSLNMIPLSWPFAQWGLDMGTSPQINARWTHSPPGSSRQIYEVD